MDYYIDRKKGIIKDTSILIVLFVIFCFLDLKFAYFITVLLGYLLMTRRTVHRLNPGFMGHNR